MRARLLPWTIPVVLLLAGLAWDAGGMWLYGIVVLFGLGAMFVLGRGVDRGAEIESDAVPADLTVHTTWGDWKIVDAVMDNSGSVAAVEGLTDVVERASTVREAGWLATGPIDRSYMDKGEWPPPESVSSELVAVTLMTDDWRFVSAELRRWARLDDEDGSQLATLADMIESASEPDEPASANGDTNA